MKARWTKWQGGHGAVHACSLELGNLLRANIKLKASPRQWEVTVHHSHLGDYETFDEAFRCAEEAVRRYASDFIQDWTIWTASGQIGTRMPKGWWKP
ncbi:MAG: hypothetical protein JOY77_01820 [Alphaproteobacteria bacterium]|nr:hypothetical protein [Alphaproteobacteria bacterium]MBV9061650.1 hypothetical protein [Alphaproteobacteria bacterium]